MAWATGDEEQADSFLIRRADFLHTDPVSGRLFPWLALRIQGSNQITGTANPIVTNIAIQRPGIAAM